jgi:hypothetical protein
MFCNFHWLSSGSNASGLSDSSRDGSCDAIDSKKCLYELPTGPPPSPTNQYAHMHWQQYWSRNHQAVSRSPLPPPRAPRSGTGIPRSACTLGSHCYYPPALDLVRYWGIFQVCPNIGKAAVLPTLCQNLPPPVRSSCCMLHLPKRIVSCLLDCQARAGGCAWLTSP